MATAYQYNAVGYYAGESEDHGLLPNNATYTAPVIQDGFIPRWNGKTWEQVENHKGEEGYLNGQPYTIKEYGPLPQGWSDTPPEPTPEEQAAVRESSLKAKLQTIDVQSGRPARAVALATAKGEAPNPEDIAKLEELEVQAQTMREELRQITVQMQDRSAMELDIS